MKRVLAAVLVACVFLSVGLAAPREASAVLPITPVMPIIPTIPFLPIDIVATLNAKAVYTIPLYRMKLVQGPNTWHGYTSNESQRAYMKTQWWVDDGIVAYVSPVRLPGFLPLFRWVYANRVTWLTLDPTGGTAPSYGMLPTGVVGYVLSPAHYPLGTSKTRVFQYWQPAPSPFYYKDYYYRAAAAPGVPGYQNSGPKCTAWTAKTLLQSVTVSSFASGLTGGSTATIQWTTTAAGGVVELLYSTDNGTNWTSIAKNQVNDGSHTWTPVPNLTAPDCRIMVKWSSSASAPASAWAVGPKFGITKNLVLIPWVIDIPPFTLFVLAPAAPDGLTATAGTTEQAIQLSWVDNSATETGFAVERKAEGGTYALLTTAAANALSYTDTTVAEGQVYVYRVRANGSTFNSEWSNEAQAVYDAPETPPEDLEPETPPELPAAPTNLQATKLSGTGKNVQLSWVASAGTIQGYKVERRTTGSWGEIADVAGTETSLVDSALTDPAITEATYRVKSYDEFGQSLPSNEAPVSLAGTTPEPEPEPKVVRLFVGQAGYYANGEHGTLDAAPVIMNSRTMLPIRVVVEALGGTIGWDAGEQKVTATLGTNTVEVWINNNQGRVNGIMMPVDAENPLVKPVLVPPGRTLLPVRFVTENLGCSVGWDPVTSEVTITYPAVIEL